MEDGRRIADIGPKYLPCRAASLKAKQLGETQISNFGLRNADCLARI